MFVCNNIDINEAQPTTTVHFRRDDLRSEIIDSIWGIIRFGNRLTNRKLRDKDVLFWYGSKHYSRRKRILIMDVAKLITDWKTVVITLSTAHDKAEIDKAEYQMDELLKPLLNAPVVQLREFHKGLTEALVQDKQVPFFIWSIFNTWGKNTLDKCETEEKAKRLRKKLANEIAEMVEPDIKRDIAKALTDALMWRDPETLEAIKDDVQHGAKPRIRGKESCIFLVTKKRGKNQPEHQVML